MDKQLDKQELKEEQRRLQAQLRFFAERDMRKNKLDKIRAAGKEAKKARKRNRK